MRFLRYTAFLLILTPFLFPSDVHSSVPPEKKLMEIFVATIRDKFIGEQIIVLKADIVFFQQVNPFWEEIKKIDFSPFKLEKLVLGERKIFDREKELTRDFREAVFLLSLKAFAPGVYTIPSFSLGYSYFRETTEVKNRVKSRPVKVEKVPILVNSRLDKDILTIGEINTYHLTVQRENYIEVLNYRLKDKAEDNIEGDGFKRWLKSLEARNQKITDFSKPNFSAFKVISKKSQSEKQASIVIETFEYLFSFYELGGHEFKVPSFHIWYLDKSQEEKTRKPMEIVVLPLPVYINSMVREGRQSFEGLKPLEAVSQNNIYYFGYIPAALGGIFFLTFAVIMATNLYSRRKITKEIIISESCSEIQSRLLKLLELRSPEKTELIKMRNELFKLIGKILGIPAHLSTAKTSPQMSVLADQSRFSKDLVKNLKSSFTLLDKLIQGDGSEQDFSIIFRAVENIVNNGEISQFTKGKKKFLFF